MRKKGIVPKRNQKGFFVCLMVVALALLALGCEIEDEIRINRDGSGTYRAKMLVDKQFASALPDIRKEAVKAGLRIVEEGETETRHFIVMARDFKNISEIGDSQNRMSFTAANAGWLRERYEFSASLPPSSNGFSRQLTIVLPAVIEKNTVGETRGNTVVWDCTKGGTLEVTAAGFALPLAMRSPTVLGLIALAVAMGILLLVLRRAPAAKHCATCGATKGSGARFCMNCGTTDAVPGVERTGG
jgi:hypothetical protein